MKMSLVVIFFGNNLICFQKWSRQRIVPFSGSPSSVTRKMVPRNPTLIDLSGESASNVSEPSKKHRVRDNYLLRQETCFVFYDIFENFLRVVTFFVLQ